MEAQDTKGRLPFMYPHSPAARPTDTSREAAEKIEGRAGILRDKCFALLKANPMTADEVASR